MLALHGLLAWCSILRPGGMEIRFGMIGFGATIRPAEASQTITSALHGHCLAHDRASATKDLQVRHDAALRRDMTGSGG